MLLGLPSLFRRIIFVRRTSYSKTSAAVALIRRGKAVGSIDGWMACSNGNFYLGIAASLDGGRKIWKAVDVPVEDGAVEQMQAEQARLEQFGLDVFCKGWFTENGNVSREYTVSIEVEKVIHREKSKYQDIILFESKKFGRVLALDDTIQLTERDEFTYHEAMAHIPLNSHSDPKKVLIIGGGDGGIAREAAKHPCVQSIVLCEIDEVVISASKKYLPFVAKGFDSPKVTIHVGDGVQFLRGRKNEFDVIISDSMAAVGSAVKLFEKPFFQLMKEALRPGGVVVNQGGSYWCDRDLLLRYLNELRSVFPVVDYAAVPLPSAPFGHAGYVLAAVSKDTQFRKPARTFSTQTLKEMGLRYYTPDVHRAAFAMPPFIQKELGLSEELCLYGR